MLGRDDDWFSVFEKAREVVRLCSDAHHVFQVSEIRDVLPDICVERFAVGEDERDVHQLLVRARLVQTVQPVRQPADGKRLTTAGGVVGEIFFADVALGGEMGRDVLRHTAHQTALMVAREHRERSAFRLVVLRLALGHAN